MNDRNLSRGKQLGTGEWVVGYCYALDYQSDVAFIHITPSRHHSHPVGMVDPATIGQCTGHPDKNGALIFEGDITRLVLPDGEVRYFEVAIKTVTREVVSHPNFDDPTSTVSITGVVFLWQGYELFPCVDEYGVSDIAKMELVGNIHDTPELLKEDNHAQID